MINNFSINSNRSNFLVILLVTYLIAAGSWWSYLLYIKNQDAWQAKISLLAKELSEQGIIEFSALQQDSSYKTLNDKYLQQERMIIGEGLVLLLFMLVGVYQLLKIQKRENALQLQQQNFLLSITHELKSPIASVQLVLETFQKRKLNEEQQQRLLTHAVSENNRLKSHINSMLLSAKVENGYQYSPQLLNLVQIIEEIIIQLQNKYSGEIVLETEKNDYLIMADNLTIQTMISNLIENAVKYAAQTAKILIKISSKNDKKLLIEICDWGAGIAKSETTNIFNKFYRIGNEHTRQQQGTGLGLYIVKKVVEAHKGSIEVRNNLPQGNIFAITLPFNTDENYNYQ